MPDYKKMYLELMNATEDAINLLIIAQQRCEERYLSQDEVILSIFQQSNEEINE